MQEKRRFKRFYFNGTVELRTKDGDTTHVLSGHLGNISLGGLRILCKERVEVDKDVEIQITTPLLDQPLKGNGKIRYLHTVKVYGADFFAMGIQFTHINNKQVRHLIDKAFGWKKKRFIPQSRRRELALLLKISLIMIPIVWLLLMLAENFSGYGGAGKKLTEAGEDLFRAVDYFLARRR